MWFDKSDISDFFALDETSEWHARISCVLMSMARVTLPIEWNFWSQIYFSMKGVDSVTTDQNAFWLF